MHRRDFRDRNMGSSVFGGSGATPSIAGMRRVDPNATSPAMTPQGSPRRSDPNSPRPVYRGDGMGAAYEPQQARVQGDKLIVPGLNDARTAEGERRRADSAAQEQQQQQQQQQHAQWQPSDVPYLAPPSPAERARQQLEPRAHPDSPTGYIPGPVSGISSGTYTSAGSVQPEQLIGRSSTRLLAPPGGASSLGWAFGQGAEPSVQARREADSEPHRSSRGSGRPRIIAGKIVHGDSDADRASQQYTLPQQERQQDRVYGRARITHHDEGGGWGGPAAAAQEEAERVEQQRQQQAYDRRQQEQQQQLEAQERQRWEQQVRDQHRGLSQKMAAAELLSDQAMRAQQANLSAPAGGAAGHTAAQMHVHSVPDAPQQVEPSAQYKFARNPAHTIRRAILSQLEQRAVQPRLQWRALCECAGVSRDPTFTRTNALTPHQFCTALKAFGTGILLAPQDVEFVFGGSESITFSRFCEWCG